MKIKIFKQSTPEKVDGDCHIQVINTIVQATTENQTLNLLKTFTPLPFDYVVCFHLLVSICIHNTKMMIRLNCTSGFMS